MQTLRDRSGSVSNGSMASKKRNFGPSSGWEEDVNDHQNLGQEIINIANNKYPLDKALNNYGIVLQPHYSTTGWVLRCACPFPDHNDKTPSFGYNPSVGAFNCFGCHRGGKAVEFIANMDGRSHIDVAREIAGNYSNDEVLLHNSNFDFEKLRTLLFDFADTIRAFKTHHNTAEAAKYVKAVTWNLDVYLRKNAPLNMIVLENLEIRISKLRSQLKVYGELD